MTDDRPHFILLIISIIIITIIVIITITTIIIIITIIMVMVMVEGKWCRLIVVQRVTRNDGNGKI